MARREFQFIEGTSKKFWAIELEEIRFTVNWGRLGTTGQTQTKEFASNGDAKKEYEKLVAEKLKKGYAEVGAGSATSTSTSQAPSKKPAKSKKADEVAAAPNPPIPAVPSPPKPVMADVVVHRSIELDPHDWMTAVWRPRPRLARPQPQPFDLRDCAARVARVPTSTYGWDWRWSAADIPLAMTSEEAHFWLTAMTQARRGISPKELAEELPKSKFHRLAPDEVSKLLGAKQTSLTSEVLLPLCSILSIEQLTEMLTAPVATLITSRAQQSWNGDTELIFGLRDYVLPYLTEAEMQSLRKLLLPQIDPKNWPADVYHRPPIEFFLAAMVGLPDALLPVVQSWTEGQYGDTSWDHTHYHQPQIIVLGLGSPQLVESQMRRIRLPLNKSQYIRGWLATTEYAALDYARDSILAITNRDECEELLKMFGLVRAPEMAAHMLELKLSSKAPRIAREWLDANVGCAISGLIPVAAGRGKLADAAIEHLRGLKKGGHADLIANLAGKEAPERVRKEVIEHTQTITEPFDAASTPPWLASALANPLKRSKLPGWLRIQSLPELNVGDRRLNDEQILSLLGALQTSPLDAPHPIVTAVKKNIDAEERDLFAWRLFEQWLAEGAPSKDKWAMGGLGHLGADSSVLKVTPMIRNWPGESQHQRAVFGLECLRTIGTDTALMALNGIAQKLKFKGLKSKAMEFMDAIAAQRGMSRTQLEDRIVPDCDLDQRGTRIFDFGPRQFRLVVGTEMKPMIKDAEGKVKSDLPAANSKDDPVKAKEAIDTWKLLKKQVKEVAKIQAERLEQAMITGRRWTPDEFQTLLVKHPLMTNLVRLLLWGGYDPKGNLIATFRVTEDQTLADADDEQLELPKNVASVGIVHPLHVPDDQKRAWGEVFGDYEIVPPFPQLGRPLYALEAQERGAKEITRFENVKIPATALVGTLERMAWTRGIPEDGGVFHEHSKPFYGADVTCIVEYEMGVPVGYMEGWEDQEKVRAFFIPGVYKPDSYPGHSKRLELEDVDPVVISEVLKDLTLLASKGKN